MRIIILVHSLRRGGAERVCMELALGMINNGDNVQIISWLDVDEYQDLQYMSVDRKYIMDEDKYSWIMSMHVSAKKLCLLIKDFIPDVIQVHTQNMLWLNAITGLKIPIVYVVHGYGSISMKRSIKGWLYRYIDRLICKLCNCKIIVVSPSMKDLSVKYYNVKDSDVVTIINGVDVSRYYGVVGMPDMPPKIIMIGTINENKGQVLGLDAIRKVLVRYPESKLLIVGAGPDMLILKRFVDIYRLAGSVELLGCREDISILLKNVHVLWQLSKSEAMPMVVLEAMSSRVPVIGFDVRGVCDTVINNETGFLVSYGDVEKIAEKTISIISDKVMWENMSQNSRELVERKYQIKNMILRHRSILEEVCGDSAI